MDYLQNSFAQCFFTEALLLIVAFTAVGIFVVDRIFFGPKSARFGKFQLIRSPIAKHYSARLTAKQIAEFEQWQRGRLKSGRMSRSRRRTGPPVTRRSSRPTGR